MANYANLKAAIDNVIKTNGNKEITGSVLNQTLNAMVNSLGVGYQFAGMATPSTNPGTPDQNVFYFATQAGTYSNFNNIVLPDGISILSWNGSWSSNTLSYSEGVFDISAYHATGGTLAEYADLTAALGTSGANIPEPIRKGGMSVKFVQSSDNNYVQYMLVTQNFTTNVIFWTKMNNASQVIADNSKVNEYISELFIASPNGNAVEGLYVSYLQYHAEDGFTFTISKNSAVVATIFRKKNLVAGSVVEMTISDNNYSDYKFIFVYNGNTTVYGASSLHWYLTENVFNLCSWPIIANYISSNGLLAKEEVGALSLVVDTKQDKPVVCNNANANKHILEMYIESGYKDGLYMDMVQFTSSDHRFTIKDSNGTLMAFVNQSSPQANQVYRFSNENITLYWVWSGLEGINVSSVHYNITVDTVFLSNWKTISSYVESHKDIIYPKSWTDNAVCNEHIEEFYIEPQYFVSGMYINSIAVKNKTVTIGIKDGSDNIVYYTSIDWPSFAQSYSEIPYNELMFQLSNGEHYIGYIKFKNLNDSYAWSSVSYLISEAIATNIENSPTIKKIYGNDKQLVLFGDSLISYPGLESGILKAYLTNSLGMHIRDIGCGGCNMAYRTPDGSDFYDSFTFPKLVDAFISGEYDANQQNPVATGADYRNAMLALKNIDKTKKLIVINEYGNNDFTNSAVQIGNMMVADTTIFDINDLDKTKCLEAMTYGIARLFDYMPDILYGQYISAYTMTDGKGVEDYVSPTKNISRGEWFRKIHENARHIGVPSFDSMESCTNRNFFTVNLSNFNTVDGTHANAYGMYLLGKSLKSMVKAIS